jgi:hypothetical protein
MAWYGVHVVMAVRFKDGNQDSFPAWENVYLVNANDPTEAENKAAKLGADNEGDSSGTFRRGDRPASWKYVGIRKTIEISNARSKDNVPADGVEITYQTLQFRDEQRLRDYAEGKEVDLRAID